MKIFYVDTETTGIDCTKNGIIQISGMIEIDGEVKEKFNFKLKPFIRDEINDEALEVSHTTKEMLESYDDPEIIYSGLIKILEKYCNKFDKNDKFLVAGYNVRFDVDFLRMFFIKCGDHYFGSWFKWELVDPMPILHFMGAMGWINLENYKLSTVCQYLGIELDAHDAFNDISATRDVIKRIDIINLKK